MKELNKAMGARIAKTRKNQNITQEALAEKLDVSVKHISSVERGKSSLSLEKMIDLCAILDISMDYLVQGNENNASRLSLPPSSVHILQSEDPSEKELFLEYLRLYDKLRQK